MSDDKDFDKGASDRENGNPYSPPSDQEGAVGGAFGSVMSVITGLDCTGDASYHDGWKSKD